LDAVRNSVARDEREVITVPAAFIKGGPHHRRIGLHQVLGDGGNVGDPLLTPIRIGIDAGEEWQSEQGDG